MCHLNGLNVVFSGLCGMHIMSKKPDKTRSYIAYSCNRLVNFETCIKAGLSQFGKMSI